MSFVSPFEQQAPVDLGVPRIPDVLFDAEIKATTVEQLIELAERPNPFRHNKSVDQEFFSEDDLRLLIPITPTVRELESSGNFTTVADAREALEPLIYTADELTIAIVFAWETSYDRCVIDTQRCADQLEAIEPAIGRIETSRDENQETVQVAELAQICADVEAAAMVVPNARTLQTLDTFTQAARDTLAYIKSASKYFGPTARDTLDKHVSSTLTKIKKGEGYNAGLRREANKRVDNGAKLFDDLMLFINEELCRQSIELLDALACARQTLNQQIAEDPDRQEELFSIDARIDELTRFATVTLKRGYTTPEQAAQAKQTTCRIGSLSLRAQMEQRQQQEHTETMTHKTRPLSAAITTAKNILRGGSKVETQDCERVKELATKLYSLTDAKNRKIFEPVHSGILVAIITDRYQEFARTIERVQARDKSDQELNHVLENRPEAALDLTHFKLAEATAHILAVLTHPGNRIKIFTHLRQAEQQKVEAFLAANEATAEAA